MNLDWLDKIDDKSEMIKISLDKEKVAYAKSMTPWLDNIIKNPAMKLRCNIIKQGITEDTFPRCACGKYVTDKKSNRGELLSACSVACHNKITSYPKELDDREWLYQKRIVEKLSLENIGKLIGCSEPTVTKMCDYHSIPKVNYTMSDAGILEKLLDREWILKEHKEKHRTLEDIADEIGSTKSTLSVYLKKHDIDANAPNSYDRDNAITSKECQEVANYILSLGFDIQQNNRTILNGREIDILMPSLSIGIEYNGIFSHYNRPFETTESRIKGRNYHLNKTLDAEKAGIELIHIFSDDWIYRQDIVKSILMSKLGKSEKIFARKCEIVTVQSSQKCAFLRDNHIQGKDSSSIAYGLKYNNELVAAMTFVKSRYNATYEWELSRFACKKFITVVGGFSKLLKHFRSLHSGSIGSYADRSRSTGKVYHTNGFELTKTNPPSYSYVNLSKSIERMHRANFMKKKIAPNDPRAEWEVMLERNYHRIWDCGTLLFVLK